MEFLLPHLMMRYEFILHIVQSPLNQEIDEVVAQGELMRSWSWLKSVVN